MNSIRDQNVVRVAVFVLSLTLGSAAVAQPSASNPASKQMPDGKQWTSENLSVATDGSFCYDDAPANCRRHGRLYTWDAAQRACPALGGGWRLPTNDEWRQLAKHYGGVLGDSADEGKGAYAALVTGGSSGLGVVFGGRRDPDGTYARANAHGFYWTAAAASEPGAPWFYNFGGQRFLNRHGDGDPRTALSVRCVRGDGAP
jgi:uncharacterized protein (TIGR02145 family)